MLKAVISDTSMPLGTTVNGQQWATKALHPSDQDTPGGGIPDEKSMPSASVSFNTKYKIPVPTLVPGDTTWDCDILAHPDPLCFGAWYSQSHSSAQEPLVRLDTLGLASRYFMNQQVLGSGADVVQEYSAKVLNWLASVRMYRPTYFGVTLTYDAPALSNQGMISAVQYPYSPQPFSFNLTSSLGEQVSKGKDKGSEKKDASTSTAPVNATRRCVRTLSVWPIDKFPGFDQLQNLPGVYTGKASDGVYLPLRLNHQDFEWKSVNDMTFSHTNWDQTAQAYFLSAGDVLGSTGLLNPLVPNPDVSVDLTGGISTGILGLPMSTWNIGHIALRGLSSAGQLYVQFRVGYELMVAPGSVYSVQVLKPVPADPVAVNAYFGISRQLADAYPESYNSLGTILPLIGTIASEVLPMLMPSLKGAWNSIKGLWNGSSEKNAEKAAAAITNPGKAAAQVQNTKVLRTILNASTPVQRPARRRLKKVTRRALPPQANGAPRRPAPAPPRV
jgi:hypothetical protein